MPRSLLRQSVLFLLIGGLQVLIDSAVFVGLSFAGISLATSNVAGRVCGAMMGFWLNGRYTFARAGRARLDGVHLRRFLVAWTGITALSTALLWLVQSRFDLQAAWLAKPAVEAAMAALGFVAWRQWVYR